MIENYESLLNQLESADSVRSDLPPAPGSERFTSIKERTMNAISDTPIEDLAEQASKKSRSKRRAPVLAGVAAAAVLAATGLTLAIPSGPANAEAEVRTAAENLTEVTSMRYRETSDLPNNVPGSVVKVSGDWNEQGSHSTEVNHDGTETEVVTFGDTEWFIENGEVVQTAKLQDPDPNTGEGVGATFAEASEQFILAALESNQVTDEGSETIEGVETTHYVIELGDDSKERLAALSWGIKDWFSQENYGANGRTGYLEDANTLSIWIADGYVYQVQGESDQGTWTNTYYDFNADFTITPPK